jgi:predicted transcriptional regulator
MQIDLTAEQEAQLSQIAAHEGKDTGQVVREVFSLGLAAEARFINAVKIGQDSAQRGDFVEPSELWADIEHILQS